MCVFIVRSFSRRRVSAVAPLAAQAHSTAMQGLTAIAHRENARVATSALRTNDLVGWPSFTARIPPMPGLIIGLSRRRWRVVRFWDSGFFRKHLSYLPLENIALANRAEQSASNKINRPGKGPYCKHLLLKSSLHTSTRKCICDNKDANQNKYRTERSAVHRHFPPLRGPILKGTIAQPKELRHAA